MEKARKVIDDDNTETTTKNGNTHAPKIMLTYISLLNENEDDDEDDREQECPSVEGQPPICLKNSTENTHQISLTLLKVDVWG